MNKWHWKKKIIVNFVELANSHDPILLFNDKKIAYLQDSKMGRVVLNSPMTRLNKSKVIDG